MTSEEITKALAKIRKKYNGNWVFYAEHALGAWTWSKMREIINSVQENDKTICYASHGSSKTFTAALIAITFLMLHLNKKEETKVITTAPTFMQVEALLWTKIAQIFRDSRVKLYGECLQTKIKIPEKEDTFAIGFSTDKPGRAEGWHAWNLLFILDEAKGIHQWMWDMVAAQSGGGNSKILVISTTDGVEPGSEFHKAATSPLFAEWNRIHVDCRDLPPFTGEKFRRYKWNDPSGIDFEREEKTFDELRIQVHTPKWEAERKKQWGEDSVLYLTKCRGQIVDELPDQIIPLWKVEKMYANYEDPDFDDTGIYRFGGDIARMGDDSTAAWLFKGLKYIAGPNELNKKRSHEIVENWETTDMLPSKDIEIKIDDTGVGGGTTDKLIEKEYTNVKPVVFNQEPNDPDHYQYAIDEMWFTMAEKIDKLACPRNDELTKQLTGRKKAKMTLKGQLKVESKDSYKARTDGKSPDLADSFLLTHYTPAKKEKESGFEIPDIRIY